MVVYITRKESRTERSLLLYLRLHRMRDGNWKVQVWFFNWNVFASYGRVYQATRITEFRCITLLASLQRYNFYLNKIFISFYSNIYIMASLLSRNTLNYLVYEFSILFQIWNKNLCRDIKVSQSPILLSVHWKYNECKITSLYGHAYVNIKFFYWT